MFAKMTMVGRLGGEPKVIKGSSGTDFVTFSVVVNRWLGKGKGPDGSDTVAEWYDFKAFQKNAETMGKFAKGTLLLLEASPTVEKWKDKDSGKDNRKVSFIVERVVPMSSGQSSDGSGEPKASRGSVNGPATADDLKDPFEDEESPFG